jgi:protein-S-isoprenylcysteine O-methyltransferase Ste14
MSARLSSVGFEETSQQAMVYLLRHLLSILVLPFTVTVIVPLWLLRNDVSRDSAPQVGWVRWLVLGAVAAALLIGLTLFISTLARFARTGRGTLAPWDPPRVLVVEGIYRYVRNPMISGVLFILLAEVLLTGSRRILLWFTLFLMMNLVYIPLLEEPGLLARFGERYRLYKKNVPRWLPRVKPWIPPWE